MTMQPVRMSPRSIVDVPITDMAIAETRNERQSTSSHSTSTYGSQLNDLHKQIHQMAVFCQALSQPSWQIFGSETCEGALILWP